MLLRLNRVQDVLYWYTQSVTVTHQYKEVIHVEEDGMVGRHKASWSKRLTHAEWCKFLKSVDALSSDHVGCMTRSYCVVHMPEWRKRRPA